MIVCDMIELIKRAHHLTIYETMINIILSILYLFIFYNHLATRANDPKIYSKEYQMHQTI